MANTAGQTFTINPTTFTNGVDLDPGPGVNIAGTLRATAGTLAVTPTNWSNIGAIESTGGTLTITGTNLSNTGTLSVGAGSILNLGGSLTAANLGTFSRTAGSTVNLTGILDLSSGTLDIGSAGIFGSGGLSSLSGTIKNGTLINTNSTPNFNALGGSTLDGVTLGSNLNFTGGSYTLIKNSLLLANGITVNLGNHSFYWNTLNPTQELKTVSGNATINAAGGYPIYAGYGGTGQTVTIGSGITLQGYGYIGDSSVATIVNAGTLVASTASQTFNISPTTLTNTGTLLVLSGATMALASGTTWTSAGSGIDLQSGGTFNLNGVYTITGGLPIVSGATVNLQSGITNAQFSNLLFQGGTAVLNSILANTALTLTLAGTSGSLRLGSLGRINGGTVATSGGVTLSSTAGTLDGVTLATDMIVEDGGSLTLLNNLTFWVPTRKSALTARPVPPISTSRVAARRPSASLPAAPAA
ncbi:MAG: hypothetical protein IPJ48_10320 [Propionivibrio sp.]|uniref:Uncharacterized protein n=1 Tax=Candidatus Propionivibrio dominans TaxID=2954373 RepID=A0A9D7I7M6_9RHOO|nr:hypothetical protein [Candidatus Propionivibrio dominans]